jgi:hypothetical protein
VKAVGHLEPVSIGTTIGLNLLHVL